MTHKYLLSNIIDPRDPSNLQAWILKSKDMWTWHRFRRAGYRAIDDICDYYHSLRNKLVASQVEPGYLRHSLPSTVPETGEAFEKIADDYHKLIVPGLVHWQHPRFFSYFTTASSFAGILGDLYATGIGCNPGFNWSASPACTELEAVVMDWAAKMFGLNAAFYNTSGIGGGVTQTSASETALIATVAARSRYARQHPDVPTEGLVLYTTTQTHSLGKKAGMILGLKVRALEVMEKDNYALCGATLKCALEEDASAGLHPFMLIATVGTTSSGAIDRLGELGEIIATVPSLWLHVDAAWAGMAMACPEYRDLCLLNEVNTYADSFCTNFHKWGLVNFDCSTLWVRDRKTLTDALDVTPEFLRSTHGDAGTVIDYRNWHLGLGRRFRALKLWFVLRSYGVQGFQKYIRQTIHCSDTFVSLIERSAQFQLVTSPCLSLSVFRLHPSTTAAPRPSFLDRGDGAPCSAPVQVSLEQLNALNREFYARLSARADVAFTRTDLNGMICIRCAVGAERTEEADILRAFDVLCEEADNTLQSWDWDVGKRVGHGK